MKQGIKKRPECDDKSLDGGAMRGHAVLRLFQKSPALNYKYLALICALVGMAQHVQAAPQRVRIDGVLATSAGLPSTGSRDVEIKAYDASTAGTLLWTSAVTVATLTEGRFSILLDASSGGTNSLMNKISELSSTGELWFEVTIDTGASGNGSIDTAAVVAPRIRSKGVTFALAASRANTADQIRGTTVDSALAPTSGQVLTYDGTKWIGATVATSGGGNFVSITGSTMTGALRTPFLGVGDAFANSGGNAARLYVPWVSGDSNSASGYFGSNNASNGVIGVWGDSYSSAGVYGSSQNSYGVSGRANGSGFGVFGESVGGSSGFFQSAGAANTNPTLLITRRNTSAANLFQIEDNSNSPMFVVGASGSVTANVLTASRLIRTDANKTLTSVTANPSDAELGYLVGVTSALQTQINSLGGVTGNYLQKSGGTMTGALQVPAGLGATNAIGIGAGNTGFFAEGSTIVVSSMANEVMRMSQAGNVQAASGYYFTGTNNTTGLFIPQGQTLGFQANGTEVGRMTSTAFKLSISGSTTNTAFGPRDDGDTGILFPVSGSIAIAVNGVEEMRAGTGSVNFTAPITTTIPTYATLAAIDFTNTNIAAVTANIACGAIPAAVINTMQTGGAYTIIIENPASGTCSFANGTSPARTARTPTIPAVNANTPMVFTIVTTGTNYYVSYVKY